MAVNLAPNVTENIDFLQYKNHLVQVESIGLVL